MSDLNDAVQSLSAEVDALEARIAAHDKADADAIAALNATITSLQAPSPDVAKAVSDLAALKTRIAGLEAAPPTA